MSFLKHFFTLITILSGCWVLGNAQSGRQVFDTKAVHELHFNFPEEDFWEVLIENYGDSSSFSGSDIVYIPAQMIFDGQALDSVGVRLRGKSSFKWATDLKKPMKIDINEYIDQEFDGLKKFNLHNGSCDPSMLRDFICYDVMRTAGVDAPRTSHCKLYLNGEYWGLYTIIEQIDRTFVNDYFSGKDGNLYKNNRWSELEWLGNDPVAYKANFEKKTNKEEDDWTDFIEFLDVLNNTPDELFEEAIQQVFNVDKYLHVLAADVMLNNWDSYIDNRRNWYLYHNPNTDLFEWIPWDYNLAMGGTFNYDGTPFRPQEPDCESLSEFFFYQKDDQFFFLDRSEPFPTSWFWDFGDGTFSQERNPVKVFDNDNRTTVCLTIQVTEDGNICEHIRCKEIDFNHNAGTCTSIENESSPYTADNPIFQLVVREDEFCCGEEWDAVCEVKYQNILNGNDRIPNLETDYDLNISLLEHDSSKVLIRRLLQVPTFKNKYLEIACRMLADNFTYERINDIISSQSAKIRESIYDDPNYIFNRDYFEYDVGNGSGGGMEAEVPSINYVLTRRINQLTEQLSESGFDCNAAYSEVGWNDLVINEFMAKNSDAPGGVQDPEGEFDDWVELYNNTNQVVELEGYYLSDKMDNPLKWAFPSGTIIEPNGYLIIWADDDEDQEGLHTNFKLKAEGEALILSHADGTVIDSMSFGEQQENVSSARLPNGTGNFQQHIPTFDQNNDLVSDLDEIKKDLAITIFPNPARDEINITWDHSQFKGKGVVRVRNILGETVLQEKLTLTGQHKMQVNQLNAGTYIIDLQSDTNGFSKKIIIH